MSKFTESASEDKAWDINLKAIMDEFDDYFIEYMANKIITRYKYLGYTVIYGCMNMFDYLKKGIKIDDNIYVSTVEKGVCDSIDGFWDPPIIYVHKNNVFLYKIKMDDYFTQIYVDENYEVSIPRLKNLIDKLKQLVKNNNTFNRLSIFEICYNSLVISLN